MRGKSGGNHDDGLQETREAEGGGVRALFSDLVGAVQQQSLQAGPGGKAWTSPPFAKLFLVLNFVLLNAKLYRKCTKSWDFESEFFFSFSV